MPMLDPFKGDGYSVTTLTAAINKLPNMYGRLQELNLMPIRGITTRSFEVEEKNGILSLLPTVPWGGPATQNLNGKRTLRTFGIPQMPVEDLVKASDVQGVRSFGQEVGTDVVSTRVAEKLQTIRNKVDQTLEYRRFGALKGIVYDADGSTVLYNYFTEFGITQKTVDFTLGTAGTDVRGQCMVVKRWIEDNLLGERMTSVRCLVSQEFFDKLVSHSKVQAVYANYQAAQERLGGDMRSGFDFGGIIWEEYRAQVGATRLIPANDGYAFPEGTLETFGTFAAPADFMETVNTIGQQYYAKMAPTEFDRGMKLHVQSNVLPICMRPGVLVRCYSSN
jgi:hypothetical protein